MVKLQFFTLIFINGESATTQSVATCSRALTQHSEQLRQLKSQPTAQKLVTTQLHAASATHQQDFFAVLAARRHQAPAGAGSDVVIDKELSKYLSDH